eukprot:6208116-Pleurochrysis_carterae.AAC.1
MVICLDRMPVCPFWLYYRTSTSWRSPEDIWYVEVRKPDRGNSLCSRIARCRGIFGVADAKES